MRIRILGAAAGGGLPQWNCGCPHCTAAARGGRIPAMTQSSIAVSGDGTSWALINASPDLRVQMAAAPAMHPVGLRASPLRSVLVTNGDIDHVAGLLSLREKQPFVLHATEAIHAVLADNPMIAVLDPALVERRAVTLDSSFAPVPGLEAEFFAVAGKVPLYLEGGRVETLEGEQTVGVALRASAKRAYYVPGCARLIDGKLRERLAGADLVLFDGTLWDDDEMIRAGLGAKTGRRMGHMPVSGPDGSIAALPTSASGAASSSTSTIPIPSSIPAAPSGRRPRKRAGRSPATEWRSCHEPSPPRRLRGPPAPHRR
jgi:pyrroloquinoline quinone biosynthesis protein B